MPRGSLNYWMEQHMHINRRYDRPALRPVVEAELPPGRKALSPHWCRPDMQSGTTLLARRLIRERRARLRAAGKLRRDPDEAAQQAQRSHLGWAWAMAAERGAYREGQTPDLDRHVISTAIH
jgi:hypothetical protein